MKTYKELVEYIAQFDEKYTNKKTAKDLVKEAKKIVDKNNSHE